MEIKSSIVDTSATAKTRWKIAQWFELRWWKNYLRHKDKEQYLSWKKNYWQDIFTRLQPEANLTTHQTIADLGCGPAGVFIALPQNKVTAVDPLIEAYENETPFFTQSDYPHTRFIKSGIEDFNRTEKYEVVFCMNCINHVHDIEKGFETLKEVCAHQGTLVLSIDAHNFSFFKYLFRLIPGDILHPHQYNLAEYQTFLEKQGFKIVKTELLKQEFLFTHWVVVAKNA